MLPLGPDELLSTTRCAELALQAPTGSLRQDWHLVVTNDREQCRRVGEVYKRIWLGMVTDSYLDRAAAAEPDPAARASWLKMMGSARYLAEHFPEVPALLVPCIDARARGLGTCWTTVHLSAEQEVADILGIPHETVQQVAFIPVAYTLGTDFRPGARKPSEQFVHWNGW